jgi:hypothetical protein
VAWLAVFARDFSPVGFPLRPLREHLPPSMITELLPLAGALALFAASRAWERKWNGFAEFCWRVLMLGILAAFLVANTQDGWSYARVLFSPLAAWERYWEFAPFSPALLAIIGLLVQFVLVGVGLVALVQALRAWSGATTWWPTSLARNVALPLLGIAVVLAFASWLLQPEVVRTVPSNGAVDMPRDTQIYVELGAEKPWVGLQNGTMAGIWARYGDTDEPLQGMSGGGGFGKFMVKPAGLLRPNAPIEVTVFRSGERPYTFHFVTGSLDGPSPMPLPEPPGFHGPVPTATPITP